MLICDVDGTVCEDLAEIASETAELLDEVTEPVVFVSGTDHAELARMLGRAARGRHVLAVSGAECWRDGERMYAAERHPDLHRFVLHAERQLRPHYPQMDVLDRGCQVTLSLIGRFADREPKTHLDPTGQTRRWVIEHHLRPAFPDLPMRIGGTTSIDAGGVDKRRGVLRYFAYRSGGEGHVPTDVVYVGDRFEPGGNDEPVLGLCPCVQVSGVAMFEAFVRWRLRR